MVHHLDGFGLGGEGHAFNCLDRPNQPPAAAPSCSTTRTSTGYQPHEVLAVPHTRSTSATNHRLPAQVDVDGR
jgi:hypothetical protein